MTVKFSIVAVLALLTVLTVPGGARAVVQQYPSPGASVVQSESVTFSWSLAVSDWYPVVELSRYPVQQYTPGPANGPDVYHFPAGIIDEQLTLNLKLLPAGTWYWRTCVSDIYGESFTCGGSSSFVLTPPTECADQLDNDEDGTVDMDDLACSSPSGATELLSKLPRLSRSEARSYAFDVLRKGRRWAFELAYSRRVRCRARSRTSAKCAVSFVYGDLSFVGSVRIWLRWCDGNAVCWHYRYAVTRFDEYCAYTGGRNCVRTFRGG